MISTERTTPTRLKLLPRSEYPVVTAEGDPLRLYFWPIFGRMYRKRVELCLSQCRGGDRILEVGFGSGVTFRNLSELYKEIHGIDLGSPSDAVAKAFKPYGINATLQNASVLDIPYPDKFFDTVLLISILEHLKPEQQPQVCREVHRVLKPGGQFVYGVPIERGLMVFMFRVLGVNIREHHFSTEDDVRSAAAATFDNVAVIKMNSFPPIFGYVYEVGHFVRRTTET